MRDVPFVERLKQIPLGWFCSQFQTKPRMTRRRRLVEVSSCAKLGPRDFRCSRSVVNAQWAQSAQYVIPVSLRRVSSSLQRRKARPLRHHGLPPGFWGQN